MKRFCGAQGHPLPMTTNNTLNSLSHYTIRETEAQGGRGGARQNTWQRKTNPQLLSASPLPVEAGLPVGAGLPWRRGSRRCISGASQIPSSLNFPSTRRA